MPLIIPGAESTESIVRFDCNSNIGAPPATHRAGVFTLTPRGDWSNRGDNTRIACIDPNYSNAVGLNTSGVGGSTNIFIRARFNSGSYSSSSHAAQAGQRISFAYLIDLAELTLTWIINGVAEEPIALPEGAVLFGDGMRPTVRSAGIAGKDTEWHELAFWHNANDLAPENVALYIPSVEDLQQLTTSLGVVGNFVQPKSYVSPTGPDGSYAASFPDLAPGSRVWTHTEGPTTGDYAPMFVGPPTEVDVDVEATARTLSVEGTTSSSGGTTYIIVDTVANLPTPPDAADIAGGFLGDGATAAAFSDSAAMATTALAFSFEGVPASTALAYAIVHDKDGAGDYSEVTYGTIITKKPVVSPGEGIWRDVNSQPIVSEAGMDFSVVQVLHSGGGVATDEEAKGVVDLTGYLNSVPDLDIGDTISVVVRRSNGESIIVEDAVIAEG